MATSQPDPRTTYTTHWVSDVVAWSHLGEPAPRPAGHARHRGRRLLHELFARVHGRARPEAHG